MSTNKVIFVIGLLVLAVPFSGFPRSWEEGFLVLAGLGIMLLSSLNIWQRALMCRLKFHSAQKPEVEKEKEDQQEYAYDQTNFTDNTYSEK